MIASLAFQEFIKRGAEELAKKLTGETIAKMGQLRQLIWYQLRGNSDAETNLSNVEQGKEEDLADIGTYLNQQGIKNPAASGRGMEADLLPNPRIRITIPKLRRRAAGNMTHTRFKNFPFFIGEAAGIYHGDWIRGD